MSASGPSCIVMLSREAISLSSSFVTLDLFVHKLGTVCVWVSKKRGLTVIYRL